MMEHSNCRQIKKVNRTCLIFGRHSKFIVSPSHHSIELFVPFFFLSLSFRFFPEHDFSNFVHRLLSGSRNVSRTKGPVSNGWWLNVQLFNRQYVSWRKFSNDIPRSPPNIFVFRSWTVTTFLCLALDDRPRRADRTGRRTLIRITR